MEKFINDLSSSKSAPGGGAASAMYAVLGSGLSSMVCALTKNNSKIDLYHKEILKLQKEAYNLIEEDKQAYLNLSNAFKNKSNVQEALIPAINAPLEIMKVSAKCLDVTYLLIGKTNKYAISDIGCAACGFASAIKSAYLNVLINLKYLKNNKGFYKENSDEILNKYIPLAEKIYNEVKNEIIKC